jgi:hypothetical protein
MAAVAGRPYVTWNEDNTAPNSGSSSQIRVARLAADGTTWEKVANGGTHPISRLSSTSSQTPMIADVAGTPWVTWAEGITQTDQEIRVARLSPDGSSWQRVVDTTHPINNDQSDGNANTPTLGSDGGQRPYVSFAENDPGSGSFINNGRAPQAIFVKRLNDAGTAWETVGGGAVSDPAVDAAFPRLAMVGGVPWLTYFQVTIVGNSPVLVIQTAHLSDDGQSWVHVPVVSRASFNDFDNPAIAAVAGRPVVALGDRNGGSTHRIRVFRLNDAGTGYDELGGGPASSSAADASGASLTDIGGAPWVSWHERGGQSGGQLVRAARLNGSSWQQVGTAANDSGSHDAGVGPVLASVNGFPWVAFGENDQQTPGGQNQQSCCNQVRVSRLEPTFTTPGAQPGDTRATLLQAVSGTYGLRFPVSFVYGPRGGSAAQSDAVAPEFDPDTVFRAISGLTPSTLYAFHAQTTAGTPLPAVTGPESVFVTNAASSGAGSAGAAPATAATPVFGGRLLVAILDHAASVRSGHRFTLRYIVTDDVTATMRVRRNGKTVKRIVRRVDAGRHAFLWTARTGSRRAPRGAYTFAVTVSDAAGRLASDRTVARVTRARR